MRIVTIEGVDKALEAGGWARQHIKGIWEIGVVSTPFSEKYSFMFSNPNDATHFALKWV